MKDISLTTILGITGFLIALIGILIVYYKDYKQNKADFKSSVISVIKGFVVPAVFLIIFIQLIWYFMFSNNL